MGQIDLNPCGGLCYTHPIPTQGIVTASLMQKAGGFLAQFAGNHAKSAATPLVRLTPPRSRSCGLGQKKKSKEPKLSNDTMLQLNDLAEAMKALDGKKREKFQMIQCSV